MGRRAVEVVSHWGPDRFAEGMLEAIDLAVRYSPNPEDEFATTSEVNQ